MVLFGSEYEVDVDWSEPSNKAEGAKTVVAVSGVAWSSVKEGMVDGAATDTCVSNCSSYGGCRTQLAVI